VDTEADSAVRDAAGSSRHDGARPCRRWQDQLYPRADEGAHRVRQRAQGDANEPEGDHGAADVRSTRRRYQRLDGRHLLDALETHAQNQEGASLNNAITNNSSNCNFYLSIC